MKKILLLLILCLPLFNSGCGLFEMDKQQDKKVQIDKADKPLTGVQWAIVKSLESAEKEDCETIYKVFSGISMYLDNGSKLTKFSEVIKLINDVEVDYKWKTETYVTLTDVIEEDLKSRNLEDDIELDDTKKKEVIGFFKEYADAVLVVLKAKNAND